MWSITGVYGPQGDAEKMLFMDEIKQLKPSMRASWMLLGDFNLIYRASDKNNPNVNRRLMNKFKSIIDELEIKELHLHGRRFTWTSETDDPTVTRIDHIFCTREWEAENSNCYVQAITSSKSDYCPMLLTCNPFQQQCKGFRFESFWTRLLGFSDTDQEAWSKPVRSNDRIRALHIKLARTARALK